MNDQEKLATVIKGLELCSREPGQTIGCLLDCPYDNVDACKKKLMRDALALLKAQEPVKPIENAGFYYCGACRYAFTSARQKYCSECGRAVKWE